MRSLKFTPKVDLKRKQELYGSDSQDFGSLYFHNSKDVSDTDRSVTCLRPTPASPTRVDGVDRRWWVLCPLGPTGPLS